MGACFCRPHLLHAVRAAKLRLLQDGHVQSPGFAILEAEFDGPA